MAGKTNKKWTFMVYMAGDNNLQGAGSVDIGEMKRVGSNDDVNVIVQFDRAGANSQTRRYYLRKGTQLARDIVGTLGETNTGDPKVLNDFIVWGAKDYPAENYLVVIWNHGAGWDDTDIYRSVGRGLKRGISYKNSAVIGKARSMAKPIPLGQVRAVSRHKFRRALFSSTIERGVSTRAIAFDDQAKDFLDNIELKRVLNAARTRSGRKISVLGMDACLMSMAEVAYQLRDTASIMVGSQEVEPGEGWPYDAILREIVRRPGISPREVGKLVVAKYVASYGANSGVTQAALDLSVIEEIRGAIDILAKSLRHDLAAIKGDVIQARSQVQSYDTPEYVDLVDLCTLLKEGTSSAAVRAACDGVLNASKKVVIASGFKGKGMANSNGLSVYFPTRSISPLYAKLDIVKGTAWEKFMEVYIDMITRRRN